MMMYQSPQQPCPGTLSRRQMLRVGSSTLAGLTLADLFRGEALANASTASKKSVIVVWLWGGPSHMETFDLKPGAPLEFRGEFDPIPTNVPGLMISEQLPLLAQQADKWALVRSLSHESNGHVNSTHTLMTGYPGVPIEMPPYQPEYPDFWAVSHKLAGPCRDGVPAHVAMPRMRYNGSAYLGGGYDPFIVRTDPNASDFKVENVSLAAGTEQRFTQRLDLLSQFDQFRRELDATGAMDSMDQFQRNASTLLTTGAVHKAFDIQHEDPKIRDRYGRFEFGQRVLLARRLVEAGVRMVTIDFPCVPGQKAFSWDDHASVWNIFEQMKIRLPVLDQVVSALIDDLHQRGLADDCLVVVMGEMSHTPRLSNFKGQPGREHWGHTMSLMLAGGGLRMGQAIGATNHKGDEVAERLVTPSDLLATFYNYFGIPLDTTFNNRAGRPTPLLPAGRVIHELG
ncbi:MAG: DUF1501 domain-containing protein [Planctomycetaceae bacterium]